MLDQVFVKRKLKMIAEDLAFLEQFRNYSLDDLTKDFLKQAAAERLLERIVIRVIDVNNHLILESGKGIEEIRGYADTFKVLADCKIYSQDLSKKLTEDARFRNILKREYNNVDKNLIHKKIKDVIDDFNKYLKSILGFLNKIKICQK